MANRYWVGGTGNWSDDDNHWATSSGGTPANGNLPTGGDDVFIDENSGFSGGGTITMDYHGYCTNFESSSGNEFTISGSFSLTVQGNFTLESGITWDGPKVIFGLMTV